jgi:hypothetical protein
MPQTTTEKIHDASRAPEYGSTPGTTDTPTEARQAVTGQGNGVVLAVSTGAVIVAFVVIYVAFFA